MGRDVILGLILFVLSIPVTFAVNFASDPLKNWWGNTSKARAIKRIDQIEAYMRSVEAARKAPDALIPFVGYVIVRTMADGMIVTVLAVLYLIAINLEPSRDIWVNRIFIGVFYLMLLGTIRRAARPAAMLRDIAYAPDYKQRHEEKLQELRAKYKISPPAQTPAP